jgi:hypothetical protein
MPSLQEYMLIEQDTVEVEVFRRSDSCRPSYYYWGDMVVLESVGLSLSVESIYERVRNEDVSLLLDGEESPSTFSSAKRVRE